MAENPEHEPFRLLHEESKTHPQADVLTALYLMEERLGARMVTLETADDRIQAVLLSHTRRLDDLCSRQAAVEAPALKRGLATAGRYTAAIAIAGALAQAASARWPEFAAVLRGLGEALTGH